MSPELPAAGASPDAEQRWPRPPRLALGPTMGSLRMGPYDPSFRYARDYAALAFHTPDGPVALEIGASRSTIQARGWGPGAARGLEAVPGLVGMLDTQAADFAPESPALRRMIAKQPGFRLARFPVLLDLLVRGIFEQRVRWVDAARAYRDLVRRHGAPAPGPLDLTLPLSGAEWRRVPKHDFSALEVDVQRARTVQRVATSWRRVEEIRGFSMADADARLRAFEGIGPWTSQRVLGFGLGHCDAVITGDYSLHHTVAFNLAGEPRADDARMLELLEPFRGQRFRVQMLIMLAGKHSPRYAPRRGRRPGTYRRR